MSTQTKPATRTLNLVQAVNEALDLALEQDPRVLVFGEDVGRMGGVFRATDNLQAKHGEHRVFDTPLAESGIVGFGIGLALAGLRPVAEIQFAGFLYPALDQILSHLGRMRHRTRGRYSIPMVIRAPYGGGVHTPEQHADSPEAILTHVPGVKVVIPSSPERAKGLLLAAIEDPDPVFFLEAIKLYRSVKAEVPQGYYTLPLGKARVVREGRDASLFCYGGMVEVCLKAAEVAAREGVERRRGVRGHAHPGVRGRGGRAARRGGGGLPRGAGGARRGVGRAVPAIQRGGAPLPSGRAARAGGGAARPDLLILRETRPTRGGAGSCFRD